MSLSITSFNDNNETKNAIVPENTDRTLMELLEDRTNDAGAQVLLVAGSSSDEVLETTPLTQDRLTVISDVPSAEPTPVAEAAEQAQPEAAEAAADTVVPEPQETPAEPKPEPAVLQYPAESGIECRRCKVPDPSASTWNHGVWARGENYCTPYAKHVAARISLNRTPRTLCLSRRGIDDKALGVLVEALKVNTTTTAICLANNLITDKGAELLSDLLKANEFITSLHLKRNKIQSEGALTLLKAIERISFLTLDLSYNSIWIAGSDKIAEHVKESGFPAVLKVEGYAIPDDTKQALVEYSDRNTHNNNAKRLGLFDLLLTQLQETLVEEF